MSTVIKKNLAFNALHKLLCKDFKDDKLAWITKGANYKQSKVLSGFEANLYIAKYEFARKAGIICPNKLVSMLVGLSFSTRNVNASNHQHLTDLVAKLCDLLCTKRYMDLCGIGKLTIANDPEILVGASSSSSTAITDVLYSPILLRVIF
jgi:hypothetical protein